jgi:hypothetical protein
MSEVRGNGSHELRASLEAADERVRSMSAAPKEIQEGEQHLKRAGERLQLGIREYAAGSERVRRALVFLDAAAQA